MKTFFALEVRVMNGTVTLNTEITLYETEELANEVKKVVEEKNKTSDSFFDPVLCTVKEVNLYENPSEVPILNEED